MRQKGESQNRCFKKTEHTKFPEKRISYPLISSNMLFTILVTVIPKNKPEVLKLYLLT